MTATSIKNVKFIANQLKDEDLEFEVIFAIVQLYDGVGLTDLQILRNDVVRPNRF